MVVFKMKPYYYSAYSNFSSNIVSGEDSILFLMSKLKSAIDLK